MKKVCRYLKLRKFKTEFDKDSIKCFEGKDFIVIFYDDSIQYCIGKEELYKCLEKDHIKRIRYIFDITDRISIIREPIIEEI